MKKVVVASAALLSALPGFSQTELPLKKFNFGISLGVNYSELNIRTDDPVNIQKAYARNETGFVMGIFLDQAISEHLSVMPRAELAFYGNKIDITKTDNSHQQYELPPTIEFATHFKYKMVAGKIKPYLLFGPACKMPLVSKASNTLELTRSFVTADVGIGAEKRFKNFVMAPEVRYSHGLTNISGAAGIPDARLNTVALVVNFKGS